MYSAPSPNLSLGLNLDSFLVLLLLFVESSFVVVVILG